MARGSRVWAYFAMAAPSKGAVGNPREKKSYKPYDPREEAIRAQRQGIYETTIKRMYGARSFRDRRGMRLDAKNIEGWRGTEKIKEIMQPIMFGMGTGVARDRSGFLVPGTQRPTRKAMERSRERYADVDELVRNRQDYEESLGIMRRQYSFYRVLVEPGRAALVYTVWPIPPGRKNPLIFSSSEEAEAVAHRLNRTADPRVTKKWWRPPKTKYRKSDVRDWLPPDWAFSPRKRK